MRIKLGTPMRLSEIALATSTVPIQCRDAIIEYISTDSREIRNGDLFIALKGNKYDGKDFLSEAKRRGAYTLSSLPEASDILHHDGRLALLLLASYYIKTLPIILYNIGITGSVGKTTTKEFLKILLQKSYKTHASESNYNNEIGMPLSILSAPKDSQILIMEMGMNHLGEISKLSKCLSPNLSIITNIGTAHIGNLGSRETIAKAKLEIMDGMKSGFVLVPDDEPLLTIIKNKKTFSLSNRSADFYLSVDALRRVKLYKNGELYTESSFSLSEEHHRKCLLYAASAAIKIGISPKDLSIGISSISNDNTRQKTFSYKKYLFYTDFYNASRESTLSFIKEAEILQSRSSKNLLLGDILELGNMAEEIHYEIGKSISPDVFKSLFLFGNSVSEIRLGAIDNGFPSDRIFLSNDLENPKICADWIYSKCDAGEFIFMKASRGIRLERVLNYFKE